MTTEINLRTLVVDCDFCPGKLYDELSKAGWTAWNGYANLYDYCYATCDKWSRKMRYRGIEEVAA